jgi:hypothetical protein
MPRKNQSTRNVIALTPSTSKYAAPNPESDLNKMRSAVASSEDADASLTGMTRSLNRRLLALNLQPMSPANQLGFMKVA